MVEGLGWGGRGGGGFYHYSGCRAVIVRPAKAPIRFA